MTTALRLFVPVVVTATVCLLASCAPPSKWASAGGNIWTGVRIYSGQGEQKTYVGEIIGGNENYTDPMTGNTFRGVKLRMASGAEEWKDRSALIQWGFVEREDPAINAAQWQVLQY